MFDFLEDILDTVAELVPLPLKPIESVLDVVVQVVDSSGETLSDIRRESFPSSIFRLKD